MAVELVYANKSNIGSPIEIKCEVSQDKSRERWQVKNIAEDGSVTVHDYGVETQSITLTFFVNDSTFSDWENFNNFIEDSKVNFMQNWFLIKLPCGDYPLFIIPGAAWYITYDAETGTLATGDSVDYDVSAARKGTIKYNNTSSNYIRLMPNDYSELPVNNTVITKVGGGTDVTANMDGGYYPVRLASSEIRHRIKNFTEHKIKVTLEVVVPGTE